MADTALIQGAAAVAAGKAAKGMAFGQGFAAGAGNIAQKIAEGVQIREQKIADGAALASANFMTWDTNGLPPKYKEIIQKEMAAANEKLNETGKNINISGAAQKSIMDKIVRDAENKAKGYIQNINLEREVGSLTMQLEDPQIAQSLSGLVNPDVHDKINQVAGSKYTLDNNNNYIFEGDEKAYSFQEVQKMVQKFKNSTYDRTQVAGIRNSNLEIAAKSKNQKDYETNIDNLMKGAYSLTNPKDVFQMKAELVNVYEQQPEDVQDLSPQQLYDKLKEIRVAYGKDTVPEPVLTPSPGVDAFKAITNLTNRYITEERLAGKNSVLLRKKIDGKEVRKVTDLGDGKFEVKLQERLTGDGIETTTLNLDILNKDDRRKIDDAFATENYSGKALGDYKNFYLQNIDSIEMPERKELKSTDTNTTTEATVGLEAGEYPENIMNASGEPIVYNKETDGSKGDFTRAIYAKYNMNDSDKRKYNNKYGDEFTEKNLLKYQFDKTGREEYNTNLANTKNEMTAKVALLQDYYNNSQEIASTDSYNVDEVKKILKKIGRPWEGQNAFTKKDLALINYIKAGNKFEDLEKDLASTFKDIEI